MCFSPQRAFFRHRNFKKRSDPHVFCTFSLTNALLATVARNFWFLLSPHDSAPAACLLFDSPDTQIIEKTKPFATSLHFARMNLLSSGFRAIASSFFWLYFISSAFQISILSEVYYLNFLRLYFSLKCWYVSVSQRVTIEHLKHKHFTHSWQVWPQHLKQKQQGQTLSVKQGGFVFSPLVPKEQACTIQNICN